MSLFQNQKTAPAPAGGRRRRREEERLGDQPGQLYETLATVLPLGPGGSWDGLGVLRGVQLGPWAAGFGGLLPQPAPGLAPLPPPPYRPRPRGLRPRVFPAHRPVPQMGWRPIVGIAYIHRPAQAPFTCPFSQSGRTLCRFRLALQRKNQGRGSPFRHTGCTTQ
jgi:hypothetical protein